MRSSPRVIPVALFVPVMLFAWIVHATAWANLREPRRQMNPTCTPETADKCLAHADALENSATSTQDLSRAEAEVETVCAAGPAVGCKRAGTMYWNGHGVAQNRKRALELLRKACDGGDKTVCATLSAAARVPASPVEGTVNACAPGMMDPLRAFAKGQNEAVEDLTAAIAAQAAAAAGHEPSKVEYSIRHRLKERIQRGDYANAFPLAVALADVGDGEGQATLGNLYLRGLGAPQSIERAVLCLSHAASIGWASASATMGELYYGNKQAEKAYRWLVTAVTQLDVHDEGESTPEMTQKIRAARDQVRKALTTEIATRVDEEITAGRPSADGRTSTWPLPDL